MVDYGGSAPYYYYRRKKVQPDPLPQPVFSDVDWTVGKFSQKEQKNQKQFIMLFDDKKTQKQLDAEKLKQLQESLK